MYVGLYKPDDLDAPQFELYGVTALEISPTKIHLRTGKDIQDIWYHLTGKWSLEVKP